MKHLRRCSLGLLLAVLLGMQLPPVGAESFEDYQPIRAGMKLTFIYIIEHFEQKDRLWKVTVVRNSYPESLTYTWRRPQKEPPDWTGTRILTDLKYSRNFKPWFSDKESKATSDTAPWISQQVLKEIRASGTASNFREGGTGAVGWAATSLTLKEQVIFAVTINGRAEALHAYRLNKGLLVWNNLNNPLVLEYEPLGVPLFTSITGWKLVAIDY